MKKTTQKFKQSDIEQAKAATPTQIAYWLEDYRTMLANQGESPSKLISLKVPENLLSAFKQKASLNGLRYQTQIKELMMAWLKI